MIDEDDIENVELVNQSDEIDDSTSCIIEDTIRSTLGDETPDNISLGVKLTRHSYSKTWDEIFTPKFKQGDLVLPINFNDDIEEEIWASRVIGYGKDPNTYYIKRSNSDTSYLCDGPKLKKAPFDAKWEPYKYDPFHIPGLKVSCPSNNYGKKNS